MMSCSCRGVARVLVVATVLAARARGQALAGWVVDKKSEKPIRDVRVVLVDSTAKKIFAETMADTTGMFLLAAPSAGTFRLGFVQGSILLGASELFTMTDTDFVQHRYLFDLPSDTVYFEFQVSKRVEPRLGNEPPKYPASLRSHRISGEVLAQFVVDTLGRADMKTFRVLRATHPDFATAVRDAVPHFRFSPASIGDRLVRQMVELPFQFMP